MRSLSSQSDVLIVGGGITGLANAWSAAIRGKSVTLLEAKSEAEGASVRNFGMVWPVGQAPGLPLQLAIRSREFWREFLQATGIWHRECGALFLFTREDEMAVANEFCRGDHGYKLEMLDREECLKRSHIANGDTILGGMFSKTEINVDPRLACRALSQWLSDAHGVSIHFAKPAAWCESDRTIIATDGQKFSADQLILCQGADARLLFPDAFDCPDLVPCKLHMMRTSPIQNELGPLIASGLTLRHYTAFEHCPSIQALRDRVEAETPELNEFGVHVMASRSSSGHLVLGDSHQYGNEVTPFNSGRCDDLIIRELRKIVQLPDKPLDQRWQGVYYKRRGHICFVADPVPGVRIFNGIGGHGMTISFGLADWMWDNWDDPRLLAGIPETTTISA